MVDEQKPEEKPKETNILEQTEALVKRMEEANKKAEENLKREELLMSRAMISGKGIATPEPQKEETPLEYAKKVMSGKLK